MVKLHEKNLSDTDKQLRYAERKQQIIPVFSLRSQNSAENPVSHCYERGKIHHASDKPEVRDLYIKAWDRIKGGK